VDVRDHYGVTATIIFEYLLAQKLSISAKLATAIFYAIKSETQDLGREATKPDRDAYLRLFPLTSKKLLCQIVNPRQPMEYFRTISRSLDNARIYERELVVNMGEVAFPEVVAEMADFLLRLDEIDTVLAMGEYGMEMILSIRTVRSDINAGEISRRVVQGRGTAGGHGMMAGGKVEYIPGALNDRLLVEQLLTERFLSEFGHAAVSPRLLAR
jgi:nanoRNase/pAp phosphatase (c-di-AMP/oligoRNAs hydrolase)